MFNKGNILRAASVLTAFLLLTTIHASSGTYELPAHTFASGVFSNRVMVNDDKTNDQSVPVIVATPDGNMLVVWQDGRTGSFGNEDIYATRFSINGTKIGPNVRVDDSVRFSRQVEPAVAVSANGTILVAWQDFRASDYNCDIYFAESYDGGATFTKNVRADDSYGENWWQERPSIAATWGGGIYIAWTDDRAGVGQLRVRGAYSTDGGATFSLSKEIVQDGVVSGQCQVSLVSNGNRLFAAFMDNVTGISHPYVCISTNGGKSFGAPIRLDNTGTPGSAQSSVAIAPMPGGGIVAAWEDLRNGNWDVYACIMNFHGVITTPDLRVDDDTTGAYQNDICIAADQLGNVYASWQDERLDTFGIRFAFMPAGELAFNSSIDVDPPGQLDMQRRPSIVIPQPGRVSVVWQDDRAGTYDVYFSSAYFAELFSLSLPKGWSFLVIPSTGYSYTASTLGLKTGDLVSRWNSTTRSYDRTFIVGISPIVLDFPLESSTGYWVFTSAHESLNLKGNIPTAKQFKSIVVPQGGGWVSVGFASLNTSRRASDLPSMLDNKTSIKLVTCYDPIAGSYQLYIAGAPSTDFQLVPGRGIWCYSATNGTLSYDP